VTQHFLLSATAKTLSLASVFRMSDAEAETSFRKIRWSDTDGAAVCPSCGGLDAYECRRPKGALRFRCKACKGDFSITSGTLSRKLGREPHPSMAARVRCNLVYLKRHKARVVKIGEGLGARWALPELSRQS